MSGSDGTNASRLQRHTWQDVRELLHQDVLSGRLRSGDKFPRDEDIAERLGCARSTVQRAMKSLAEDGVVERRRKGGTRVSALLTRRVTLDIPVIREEIQQQGRRYGYRLLQQQRRTMPARIVNRLKLRQAEPALHLQALHLADGQPRVFEDRWVALDTVPELLDVDLTVISANEWLVRHRPYSECTLHFSAINADRGEAGRLEIHPGSALFVTERTTWIHERPITFVRNLAAPGYRLTATV